MKRNIITLLVLLVIHGTIANAQKKNPIYLNSLTSSVQNNNLDIDLTLDISECNIKRGNSIYLYPILASSTDTLSLPNIIINSRSAHQTYKRFPRHHSFANALVVHELRKNDKTLDYTISIKNRPWMKSAKLLLYKADCFCGNIKGQELILVENMAKSNKPFKSRPRSRRFTIHSADSLDFNVTEYQPIEEYEKTRFEHGEAYLNFKQGKSEILFDYKNNGQTLSQTSAFFNRVVRDQDIDIKSIKVVGYCSIEGTYKHNLELSRDRAKSFTNWLRGRYPELNGHYFDIQWKGEDWDRLAKLIDQSEYYWKYGALDVIYRYGVFDGREQKLMSMHGGNPYRQMYKEYFPLLRRVYYRIDYTVRPFDVEESEDIIQTNPQKLSIFEMYALAESYGRDSDQFYNTIDKAADTYPTDLIAINNAAAFAMSRGEYDRALDILTKAPDSTDKFNNLGVLFALQNDMDTALYWLSRAAEDGSEEAITNLEIIQLRIKNKAKKEIHQIGQVRIPF